MVTADRIRTNQCDAQEPALVGVKILVTTALKLLGRAGTCNSRMCDEARME
jgi:hypothetical protein